MRRFLVPDLDGDTVDLPVDEARHALRVLRLRIGDALILVDGQGGRAEAVIEVVDGKRVRCAITARTVCPPPTAAALTLAVAAPKGGRFDDLVRAVTECGVGRIVPLRCARVSRVPDAARALRVACEAIKQCGRCDLPEFGPVWDIDTLVRRPEPCIIADPQGAAPCPGARRPTILVIGPEGGFTDQERERLLAKGTAVRLADTILRIETAAVAACAVWTAYWEHHG